MHKKEKYVKRLQRFSGNFLAGKRLKMALDYNSSRLEKWKG